MQANAFQPHRPTNPISPDTECVEVNITFPFPPLLFQSPIPHRNNINYSSFATSFLTGFEIRSCWNNIPIVLDESNSISGTENQFLNAVGRISVEPLIKFQGIIFRGSVINFRLNNKYFATNSQLMDSKNAYIHLVAYNKQGLCCDAANALYGNQILVILQCWVHEGRDGFQVVESVVSQNQVYVRALG